MLQSMLLYLWLPFDSTSKPREGRQYKRGDILYLWEKEAGEQRHSAWNLLVMEGRRIYLRILNIVFIDLFYFVIGATRKVFFYTVIQLLDCFSSAGVRKNKNAQWMDVWITGRRSAQEPQQQPSVWKIPNKGSKNGGKWRAGNGNN